MILKISAVLAFSGMPRYPIRPAVIMSAIRFGMREIMIILAFAKSSAMESVMRIHARTRLSVRLSMRNLLPLIKIIEDPVIVSFTESESDFRTWLMFSSSLFVFGMITLWTSESIRREPMSAICREILMRA